jgi:aspartate-semialdehyde dehydrogenase
MTPIRSGASSTPPIRRFRRGRAGWTDLEETAKGNPPKKFTHPIYNNCLPHIDVFLENGYTKEEMKMVNETRKIMGDDSLRITATTVRVPVFNSHSESINAEFEKPYDLGSSGRF